MPNLKLYLIEWLRIENRRGINAIHARIKYPAFGKDRVRRVPLKTANANPIMVFFIWFNGITIT